MVYCSRGDKVDRYEKTKRLSDEDFKQIIGVKRETFDAMVEVLRNAYAEKHKRRGLNPNFVWRTAC